MANVSFRDLRVWRESVDLAVEVCSIVRAFESADRFGIGSQLERSSISVPSNIAEGAGRLTPADKRRFFGIARGSLNELETQIVIATRLALFDSRVSADLLDDLHGIGRALAGLIRATNRRL